MSTLSEGVAQGSVYGDLVNRSGAECGDAGYFRL